MTRRHGQLRLHRRLRGFTLPEVLVSIAIVGAVMPVVLRAVNVSMAAADDARRKAEATALAQNKLTELAASLLSDSAIETAGDFSPDRPQYFWSSEQTSVDVNLARLDVRVYWISRGVERDVRLSTYVRVPASGNFVTDFIGDLL